MRRTRCRWPRLGAVLFALGATAAPAVGALQNCFDTSPGQTVATDGGAPATAATPLEAAITTGVGGTVCVDVVPITVAPPAGIAFVAGQVDVSGPPASPGTPYQLAFQLDPSALPSGTAPDEVVVHKDGVAVPGCLPTGQLLADPDPCFVGADVGAAGTIFLSALATSGGSWTFGVKAAPPPPPGCKTAADCDDANPCTADRCSEGACVHDAVPDGTGCGDGDVCNGEERCQTGACLPAATFACGPAASVAWLAAFADGRLAAKPLAPGGPTVSLALDHPWGVAVNPRRHEVYVTGRTGDRLSVVDADGGGLLGAIAVAGEPLGVAVSPQGDRVWVASYRGGLTVVDPATRAVVATVRLAAGPTGVAVHPGGGRVYVTDYRAGLLSVVDAGTSARLADVAVGRLPLGVAVHPAGTKVYVANHRDGTVSVVGTVSNTVTATFAVGAKPFAIAFDPTGARAYVTNGRDGTVSVVDAATDRVVETVAVGTFPFGVAVDPATGLACVATAANGGALVMLDASGAVSASLPAPRTPVSLGAFVGPGGACPAPALACDDADPFTDDRCDPAAGCVHAPAADPVDAGLRALETTVGDPAAGPADATARVGALVAALRDALAHGCGCRTPARALRLLASIVRAARSLDPPARQRVIDVARGLVRQLR